MEEKDALRRTLADAGCDSALTERFVLLAEQGREREGLALLSQHRRDLLERCHAAEKKIDCLDYLVYQMERRAKNHQGGISHGRKSELDPGMG